MAMNTGDKNSKWKGARISDVTTHPLLDMKPRRINVKALSNITAIKSVAYVRLGDVAEVVDQSVEFSVLHAESDMLHLIEGGDIRAVEGLVVLKDREKRWEIEVRKTSKGYPVSEKDVVIGLVRPERRNIGMFIYNDKFVYASTDGVAIVRERPSKKKEYPIEWLFQVLRTEQCRIQLWTESGGTSYGKLTLDQIRNVLIPIPKVGVIAATKKMVAEWMKSTRESTSRFHKIWDSGDKVAILNSPLIGLEGDSMSLGGDGTGEDD
jgi:type I restriction enzyme M protein